MADEIDTDSLWSREQNKAFEDALVAYPDENSDDRWEKIATNILGKSVEEIKYHYELLIEDLDRIESGIVPLPCYSASSAESAGFEGDDGTSKNGGKLGHQNSESVHGGKALKADQERRKGIAWTEDEHRLFLLGLEKYGKGDWRSISRNFVITRTPTQVASHAQKYFIRLNSMNRERRRSSIHDITSVNNGDTSASQTAITGQSQSQTNASPAGNQSSQITMVGGITVGQPVGLPPLIIAVGTPVNVQLLGPPSQVGPSGPIDMSHR